MTATQTPATSALTSGYLRRAALWLVITTLAYSLVNGAQIFETATIVPSWTTAPPRSLGLFHGAYGLDFMAFWITMHTVHELTFLLAIVFAWKVQTVRNWLLALFAAHAALRVWTLTYFAPTLIAFQHSPISSEVDPALVAQAALWQDLNYLRVGLFVAVSVALLPLVARVIRLLYADDRARAT